MNFDFKQTRNALHKEHHGSSLAEEMVQRCERDVRSWNIVVLMGGGTQEAAIAWLEL